MATAIELQVNGTNRSVTVEPERSLLSVLRDEWSLTGAKYGCGEGQCGACTVLVDGYPQRSCLTPVGSVIGRQITTIEGLAPAIGNAIFDATGIRLRSLPLIPNGLKEGA